MSTNANNQPQTQDKTVLDNPWYLEAVFYQVYIRAFHDSNGDGIGDIQGLIGKLDYIRDLGVDGIWIMPHFPSPLKDDGYDISDHYDVHPDYGSLDDFRNLVTACHNRGLKILIELIPNHISDQHKWFQEARRDPQSPYRDYFVWSDTGEEYGAARIIFTDYEQSNWTFDQAVGKYYWHRFFHHQPDLNYDNPAVLEEMLNIMRFWLDIGIDGFRVDAAPYLVEREGTSCENLPETHNIMKRMRQLIDEEYLGTTLLCESNQWIEDVMPYFGSGHDEFHLAYNFPLMPRIFLALATGNSAPIYEILEATPPVPPGTAWVTFLRNHDELTLEMVTDQERSQMYDHYAPDPDMKKNAGIRRRLAPLLGNDSLRIEQAYALILSLPGSCMLYYGDELGMGDNLELEDRYTVRTPMQWEGHANGGFSAAEQTYAPVISEAPYSPEWVNVQQAEKSTDSLLWRVRNMLRVRKLHVALRRGKLQIHDTHDASLMVFTLTTPTEKLLVAYNLSTEAKPVEAASHEAWELILGNASTHSSVPILPPHGWVWMTFNY